MYSNFDKKNMIQKEGMDIVHNLLIQSLQVFEMSIDLFHHSNSHQRQFISTSIAILFLVKRN